MAEGLHWLLKGVLALPGALVMWKGYKAYRRRQVDPTAPRNHAQDRWWRILVSAGSVALGTLLITMIVPRQLFYPLFSITIGAVLVTFVACFAIGWTSQ